MAREGEGGGQSRPPGQQEEHRDEGGKQHGDHCIEIKARALYWCWLYVGVFKKATAGCVKNGNGKQTVWWVVSLSRENIADGIPRAGIYRLDIELKIYPKGRDRANTRYTIRKQGEMSTIL